MTMMEMAYKRAEALGLGLRVVSDSSGAVLFALEYPEEDEGSREGLAIRVRHGVFAEEAATWLLGQMASVELGEQADRLSQTDSVLTLEGLEDEMSTATPTESPDSETLDRMGTAILESQLYLSLLLDSVRTGDPSSEEIERAIAEIGEALNRAWLSQACQDENA